MTNEQHTKQVNNKRAQKVKLGLQYSLITLVLLVCIIQLSVSVYNNINKTISFQAKKKELENKRNEELTKNEKLKSELENFNSDTVLQSIARNNLKMAEEDEILIIMKKQEE